MVATLQALLLFFGNCVAYRLKRITPTTKEIAVKLFFFFNLKIIYFFIIFFLFFTVFNHSDYLGCRREDYALPRLLFSLERGIRHFYLINSLSARLTN